MNKKVLRLLIFLIILCGTILFVLVQNKEASLTYKKEVALRDVIFLKRQSVVTSDHIFGDINSPIKIFVYSAANCQYCRAIYPKLKSLVNESEGTVSLIYRQLPISYNRGKISNEEIVSECIAEANGNVGFFKFIDSLFEILPPDEQLSVIPDEAIFTAAESVGFNKEVVTTCLEDTRLKSVVAEQHYIGELLGVTTIPHTYFVSNSKVLDIVGNKPYSVLDEMLISVLPQQ